MSAAADASGQLAGLNCSENRMPLVVVITDDWG